MKLCTARYTLGIAANSAPLELLLDTPVIRLEDRLDALALLSFRDPLIAGDRRVLAVRCDRASTPGGRLQSITSREYVCQMANAPRSRASISATPAAPMVPGDVALEVGRAEPEVAKRAGESLSGVIAGHDEGRARISLEHPEWGRVVRAEQGYERFAA